MEEQLFEPGELMGVDRGLVLDCSVCAQDVWGFVYG